LGTQVFGDISHLQEGCCPVRVDPAPELAGAHPELFVGYADCRQGRFQSLAAEARQRQFGRPGLDDHGIIEKDGHGLCFVLAPI
jgi:hypothetical protein